MSNKYQVLQKHNIKNLLIDTGPLSLLLIGSYNIEKVAKFSVDSKRFEKNDFKLLIQFIQDVTLFITPQVLAETNNIVGKYIGKKEFEEFMKLNMVFMKDRLTEIYINKGDILDNDVVLKFGVTDTSIFLSSKGKALLTIDWALKGFFEKNKIPAYHLDDITSAKWIMSGTSHRGLHRFYL